MESNKTVNLVFNQIVCHDEGVYRWSANYIAETAHIVEKDTPVIVKAKPFISQDGILTFSPNANIEEGDKVVFTCTGDVGNEPAGHLGWFYYLNNVTSNAIIASSLAIPSGPVYQPDTCSYRRTSTLELTMSKEFHNVMVRCTAQQDRFDENGDGYVQTNTVPVYYPLTITSIENRTVDESTPSLNLTCNADANPEPIYTWVLPDGSARAGRSYRLTNIQVEESGNYICVVYNTYKRENHTVNETTYIDVHKRNNKTTMIIIIAVCVSAALVIVIIVLCMKRRKNQKGNGTLHNPSAQDSPDEQRKQEIGEENNSRKSETDKIQLSSEGLSSVSGESADKQRKQEIGEENNSRKSETDKIQLSSEGLSSVSGESADKQRNRQESGEENSSRKREIDNIPLSSEGLSSASGESADKQRNQQEDIKENSMNDTNQGSYSDEVTETITRL